jgi:pseudouridine-5'-phosphate glycosidase
MIPMSFSPEVSEAMKIGTPIVALESTIISHGMPYPQNVETARLVEAEVRANGAAPATIAVIEGVLCIGLDDAQLEMFGQADGVAKLSRADIAACLASGGTGATTVAATMIAVHRGADQPFDISADLPELAQTPVTVVAAGAKAILDLPKTFEVLETYGVPVIAYGQDELPAFWSRSSGIPAPLRMDSAEEIARAHQMRGLLDLPGGQLVANPIPVEAEIAASELAPVIEAALKDAEAQGITAKDVTPFLLDRMYQMTEGRSLTANIALVLNNARLAAKIASALHELTHK